MLEIWKDVSGFEGRYQISTCGRVKSLSRAVWNGKVFFTVKEKIMCPQTMTNGYHYIRFWLDGKGKNYSIHRLVLQTFIGLSTKEVNHKNGIKTDNNLFNLEYVTSSENKIHAWTTGLISEDAKLRCRMTGLIKPSLETRLKMSESAKKDWVRRHKEKELVICSS